MNKKKNMREWLQSFNGRHIKVEDIISFCALSCISFKNSEEMYRQSKKIDNPFLKSSLLIIAIEELSKSLIVFNILPALYEKFKIDDDEMKEFLNNFYSHSIKQDTMSNYGKMTGMLDYKICFTDEEFQKLDQIKQSGFYTNILNKKGDIHIPYHSSLISEELIDKIEDFLSERIKSFAEFGYRDPGIALGKYLSQSLFNKKEVLAQKFVFLEDVDLTDCETIEDLKKIFEEYEQIPKDGELYVDDFHPESSIISMILMMKHIVKRKLEGGDKKDNQGLMVLEKSIDDSDHQKIAKNMLLIYEVLANELSKSEYYEKINSLVVK